MRFLASLVALLALTTGCSILHPAASPKAEDGADPWTNFNNGYAKGEQPTKDVPATKAASSDTPKPDAPAEKTAAEDDDKATATKKGGKKGAGAGKKKPAAAATPVTKPRKRAKK